MSPPNDLVRPQYFNHTKSMGFGRRLQYRPTSNFVARLCQMGQASAAAEHYCQEFCLFVERWASLSSHNAKTVKRKKCARTTNPHVKHQSAKALMY